MYRGARGSPSHQTFKACTEQKYSWTTQTCTADVGLYLLSSFWSNLSSITVPKRCFPRTQNAAKISTTDDLFRWSKVLCLLQLRPLCFVGVTPSPFAVARSRFLSANAVARRCVICGNFWIMPLLQRLIFHKQPLLNTFPLPPPVLSHVFNKKVHSFNVTSNLLPC